MDTDLPDCIDASILVPSVKVMQVGYYRFWNRVEKCDVYAHRHFYEECFGEIPDGFVVMHKCDNKLCVNPEHLQLGTASENIKDMWRKGRGKRLEIKRGNDHPRAKLRECDVVKIRGHLRDGMKQRDIASLFGVHQTLISAIKTGEIWGHVQ